MNKRLLEGYRQRLKQLEARMQTDAQAVSEQARGPSGGQAAGDLSNAPMHLGDMGTEEFLQDINATLLENEEFLVGEVHEALHRIDAGTYGRCEECGQEIPRERLDALPYARFCTKCAEAAGLAGASGRTYQPIHTVFNRSLEPADENLVPPDLLSDLESRDEPVFPGVDQSPRDGHFGDSHAAGMPGGGSAVGGLAGSNSGYGDPDVEELEEAMASGEFDRRTPRDEPDETPRAGHSGGAVGGTPAGTRTRAEQPPSKG
jgi:RNA polymerase-binding transcription factor DksA